MLSYNEWKNQFAYVGHGCLKENEGTMEEAILYFFYEGIDPWMKAIGYKWLRDDDYVANKLLSLCYLMDSTKDNHDITLNVPRPMHRNLKDDRETFDLFVDTECLITFVSNWDCVFDSIGKRYDYLIKEFCYTWIDVSSGNPGAFTEKLFEAESGTDDDIAYGPDITSSSKKKTDLY
jgi:hypothetical protein